MRRRRPVVLYVNGDNELDASVEKLLLEQKRHEVIAATSREALSVLTNNAVDAVILDVEYNGYNVSVVNRMKDIKRHVPLVLVVDGSQKIHPRKTGTADAILLKGDVPGRLLSVLDNLLSVRYPFFTRWFGNWKWRVHS